LGSSVVTEEHQCALSDYTFCARFTTGAESLHLSCHLRQIADEIKAQPRGLNQTAQDWHTRVVTLSEAKGLGIRFFAALRMTFMKNLIVKRTNVLHSGLAAMVNKLVGTDEQICSFLARTSPSDMRYSE